jgi:ATPase subunit of ABC transporter with duplicated ATPase domains
VLKLILGALEPDSGSVRLGTNVSPAYFDQMREALDPEKTVAETISPGSDWVELAGGRKHVMSYWGDFLFPPRRAQSPVRMLSGGERNRQLLARLFAKPANVLVLDEPTNDLDIESLELLEAEQKSLAAKMSEPEYFKQAPEALKADRKRDEEIEALMLQKLERWEALEAKAAPGG